MASSLTPSEARYGGRAMTEARHRYVRPAAGFSLMELLMALAIVSILTVIAVPAYQQYVERAREGDAQAYLTGLSGRLQTYRMGHRVYPSALGSGTGELEAAVPDSVSDYYSISYSVDNSARPPNYQITATPKTGTAQEDAPELEFHSDGTKKPEDAWDG